MDAKPKTSVEKRWKRTQGLSTCCSLHTHTITNTAA